MGLKPKNVKDFNLKMLNRNIHGESTVLIKGGSTVIDDMWVHFKDLRIDVKQTVDKYIRTASRRIFNHFNDVMYVIIVLTKAGTVEVIPSVSFKKKSFGDVKTFPDLSGKLPLILVKLTHDGSSGLTGIKEITNKDIELYKGYGNFTIRGEAGDTGPIGVTGQPGITGFPGITGSQGLTGQRGATGIPGVSVQGETGFNGIEGEADDAFIEDNLIADFEADTTCVHVPGTVNFTDLTEGEPVTWNWDFGDGGTSTDQHPTYMYTSPGLYKVGLVVMDVTGKVSVKEIEDYIQVCYDLIAGFTGAPVTGASPLSVDFVDTSTGCVDSWWWDFGDGNNSNQQNPTHEYVSDGDYTVSLTVRDLCDTDDVITKEDYIKVSTPVIPLVADFCGVPTFCAAPFSVCFFDLSTGPVVSWCWNFCGGVSSPDDFAQNPTTTFNSSGLNNISLTVFDGPGGTGNSDTATKLSYIIAI